MSISFKYNNQLIEYKSVWTKILRLVNKEEKESFDLCDSKELLLAIALDLDSERRFNANVKEASTKLNPSSIEE